MKGRRVSGASASLGRPVGASLVFRDAGVTFRLRCLHSSSVPSHFSLLLKKHLRTIWKLNESRIPCHLVRTESEEALSTVNSGLPLTSRESATRKTLRTLTTPDLTSSSSSQTTHGRSGNPCSWDNRKGGVGRRPVPANS